MNKDNSTKAQRTQYSKVRNIAAVRAEKNDDDSLVALRRSKVRKNCL